MIGFIIKNNNKKVTYTPQKYLQFTPYYGFYQMGDQCRSRSLCTSVPITILNDLLSTNKQFFLFFKKIINFLWPFGYFDEYIFSIYSAHYQFYFHSYTPEKSDISTQLNYWSDQHKLHMNEQYHSKHQHFLSSNLEKICFTFTLRNFKHFSRLNSLHNWHFYDDTGESLKIKKKWS